MTRRFWVLLHRYAGLYMALFLIVSGITGSLIAFYDELDRAVNPHLYRAVPRGTALDAPGLIERAETLVPEGRVTDIILHRAPGESAMLRMEPRLNPATGEPYVLDFTEFYLDPYSGEELGRRRFGDLSQGLINLMPFIYRFHYGLALGEIGTWLLGIAALIWALDCFVGFYLTLPPGHYPHPDPPPLSQGRGVLLLLPCSRFLRTGEAGWGPGKQRRSFWARWKPVWCIKWRAGTTRLNFDLHRAGGLWVWPMLLVFAWSAVAFNLGEQVYKPVMKVFLAFEDTEGHLPNLDKPLQQPALGWREALRIGRELMAGQAVRHGFAVEHEVWLWLDREHGVYHYGVHSDRDIGATSGMTMVIFDANSGVLKVISLPSGQYAGNTVTNWLSALHQGEVFGLPYRIFVCMMGFMIATLSVTGIVIWLRKCRSEKHRAARSVRPSEAHT